MSFNDVPLQNIIDFGELKAWDVTQKDLIDVDIIIVSATLNTFQSGDAYICEVYKVDDDLNADTEPLHVLMGGKAVVNQITRFIDKLPFLVRVETYKDKTYGRDSYRLAGASEKAKIAIGVFVDALNAQGKLPF